MTIFAETLQSALSTLGIEPDAALPGQLERHWRLVCEYNQKFNLTAIRDDAEAALKHYADCLLMLPRLRERAIAPGGPPLQCVDIGSGAGFPGLVLALACPASEWLLLEANNKKCRFLELCIEELGITNARVLCARAEEAGHEPGLRGSFELVTARAVSALAVLTEYALPLLREGGLFAACKGPALAAEQAAAQNALTLLGARPAYQDSFTLPGFDARYIAWYQKTAPTPDKYPRRAGMPEKRPL